MNSITSGALLVRNIIFKKSPSILTALAIGGVFTTAVLTADAKPKAMLIMED